MSATTTIALLLALASTVLLNAAYLREHAAAASLPPLSVRYPLRSLALLLGDRGWLAGFAMESLGFLLYVAALRIGSLALVQTVGAGGLGLLAYAAARRSSRRLVGRELSGVVLSVVGLGALGGSLARGSGTGGHGSTGSILLWIAVSGGIAVVVVLLGRAALGFAAAAGVAGGLCFSIGDLSTKVATQGGDRLLFAIGMGVGYLAGTSLLQLGYQRGGALTVAGLASLLTNALPIAAGTLVLGEPLPPGVFGALRVLAFAAVSAGAFFLARPAAAASVERDIDPLVERDVDPL